ncbi:amidohydrolase family protein [Devosia algicola]|uniref:amidohydrolase family protein n=1 Tax=Devosia algicola TaxID=3026418 RepID=UPI003899674C
MRNYLDYSGKSLVQAAHASSLTPARVLGMEAEIGSIEIGKRADFAVLRPGTLDVAATIIGGEQVYTGATNA